MSDWAMKEGDDVDIIRKALEKRKKVRENGKPACCLLCSLANTPSTSSQRMARFLVQEALNRGSTDNVCAIVIWLES